MRAKLKMVAFLAIIGHLFISCQKEKISDENAEEAFKSTEAFSAYLQTLDVNQREAAIEKFVKMPSERPNTVRVLQKKNRPEPLTTTMNCEGMDPDFANSAVDQDVIYNLYGQSPGYYGVVWSVCKNTFGIWTVDSEETIEVTQSNGYYSFTGATHHGSTLVSNLDCPLPMTWDESSHKFDPMPGPSIMHMHSIVKGYLTAFGFSTNREGKVSIHFN